MAAQALQVESPSRYAQMFPLYAAGFSAVAAALVTILIAPQGNVPFFSREVVSISTLMVFVSAFVGFGVTALGYRLRRPQNAGGGFVSRITGRVSAALIIGFLLASATIVIFYVLTQALTGVVWDRWAVVALAACVAGILGFGVGFIVVDLGTSELFILGVATLVVGVSAAMLMSADPDWYTYSLSYLGAHDGSAIFFNIALILAGLIVFAAVADINVDLRMLMDQERITPRTFKILRTVLIISAIMLTCVGIFNSVKGTFEYWIHQITACGFFIIIGLLELAVPRIAPGYPTWFKNTSYVFFAVTIALVILSYVFNLIAFTFFEILLVGASLVWFLLFQIVTDRLARGNESKPFSISKETMQKVGYAFRIGLIAGIASVLVAFVFTLNMEMVPLQSETDTSVDSLIVMCSVVVTLITAAFSYRRFTALRYVDMRDTIGRRVRRLIFRIIVSLVLTLLAFFLSMLIVYILNNLFIGASATRFVVLSGIFGIGLGLGLLVTYIVSQIREFEIWVLMGATASVGLLWAMTHAADPDWWQYSVSFLSHDEGGDTAFRISVMLVGLLMIAAIEDLRFYFGLSVLEGELSRGRYRILVATLYAIAVLIFMVGLFPTVVSPISDLLHNIGATGFSLTFVALCFVIRWLLPFYPAWFKNSSMIVGLLAIADMMALYVFNLINFVTVEIILFALIGVWIVLFERATQAYYESREDEYNQLLPKNTIENTV